MRLVLLAALLAAAVMACGGDGAHGPSPVEPDTVYVFPRFAESVGADLIPQINDYDWQIDGSTTDHNGMWALSGSTVLLRVHSPLYETLDFSFVVPDTASRGEDALRRYYPVITVHRLVPALLRVEWGADFTGPTIRIEIYAPHGLAGVRLTSVYVYWQACLDGTPFPCDVMISGSTGGSPWADPTALGLQGRASLAGPWWGWPSALPPAGYVGEYVGGVGTRGWSTVVNVNIADDQGHVGHGSCFPGFIPITGRDLTCGALFTQ